MKTQDILEQADQTAKQVKSFYNRAVVKTCEGSKAADELLHHHTYKTQRKALARNADVLVGISTS